MVKTYFKTIMRMFRHHIVRFLNIIAIIVVSVGFMSGVGEAEQVINRAYVGEYREKNVSDLFLKGQFSPTDCDLIEEKMEDWGLSEVHNALSYDEKIGDDVVRFYYMDMNDVPLNKFALVEGRLPSEHNEVLVERKTSFIKSYRLGETITLQASAFSYTVVGIIENPLILINKEEPSYLKDEETDEYRTVTNVIYFSMEPPVVTDVYLTLQDRTLFNAFSKEYNSKIAQLKEEIGELLPDVSVLGLKENKGVAELLGYAEKVGLIGIIFVIFFLLVTALVVFSNMTRLIDEERAPIACMKTLGFSKGKILFKYLLFIGIALVLGGALAWPVGYGLSAIIFKAFTTRYNMPPMPGGGNYFYFLFSCVIILVSSLLVTLFVGLKTAKAKPARLLVPKAPAAGKKTLLEHIPFIWNRFSFKYKSSIRNVFLFKSRFFMTAISVMGSTILVLAGFGLLDCVLKNAMAKVISIISVALIIFAGALCILVVYNIATISIAERRREIATLKVLGYHNKEVVGYIFREIFITNLIGALLGLPVGFFFLKFVFKLVNIGSIGDVNWWTWIVAPAVTIVFTAITVLMLYRQIVKTDMNASLKAVE